MTHHGLFPNSNDISILLHVSSHTLRPFHVLLLDALPITLPSTSGIDNYIRVAAWNMKYPITSVMEKV